jgi:hypothetical protein
MRDACNNVDYAIEELQVCYLSPFAHGCTATCELSLHSPSPSYCLLLHPKRLSRDTWPVFTMGIPKSDTGTLDQGLASKDIEHSSQTDRSNISQNASATQEKRLSGEKAEDEVEEEEEDGRDYPSGPRLIVIIASMCFSVFCMALV